MVDDPDDVEPAVAEAQKRYGTPNLALLADRDKGSPVLVVDIDGEDGVAQAVKDSD